MTRTEAHALLNATKEGAVVSEALITAALRETGDIDCAQVIRAHSAVGAWERSAQPSLTRPAHPFDCLQVTA